MDALTAIGETVSTKEHLDIILDGLPKEYISSFSIIDSCFHKISIDEVKTTLLGHEARLDKFKKKAIASIITIQFPSSHGGHSAGHGGHFTGHGGRGCRRYAAYQCHMCHRYGHIAANCFYDFEENYVPVAPLDAPGANPVNSSNTASTNMYSATPQLVHYSNPNLYQYIHSQQTSSYTAMQPVQQGLLGPRPAAPPSQVNLTTLTLYNSQQFPQAMVAASVAQNSATWYPDSGALNHVTNASQNIQELAPFD